jgi:hypothetical protein
MPVKWTPLKNSPASYVSAMWLMQDGSILANLYGVKQLVTLRPDKKGSYVNGTWSSAGSFNREKLFFASAVLSDGRLVACGGEYSGPNNYAAQDETNVCEIYNLFHNPTWRAIEVPPPTSWANIGDASSIVVDDRTFMIGNPFYDQVGVLNIPNLTWSVGGGDGYDEETWTLLPTGDVITTSCTDQTSERYNVRAKAFGPDQSLPVQLGKNNETGPAITLMDGRVICFGATGHTCIYTPGSQGHDGTWVQGPDFPINPKNNDRLFAADVSAILESNGKVFLLTQGANTPSAFVEYDPVQNVFSPILPGAPSVSACNVTRILLLPNGRGLIVVAQSGACYELTFSDSGDPSWAPTITSFPSSVIPGKTVTLAGTQLCGLSECQSFGDDNQQAENYPMVRFEDQHGDVTYARAHDVSTRSIAPGKAGTVFVDIPNLTAGKYSVYAVAMGIPSRPVTVEVLKIGRGLSQRVGDMDGDGKDEILVSGPSGVAILKQSGTTMISLVKVANGDHIGDWELDTASDDFRLIADFDRSGRSGILVTSPSRIAILKLEAGKLKVLASAANGTRLGGSLLETKDNVFGPAADFDGDGAHEVLVTSPWGLGVLKYANGTLTSTQGVANGTSIGGWKLDTGVDKFGTTADFNQDGSDEILVTNPFGMGILPLGTPAAQVAAGNTAPNGTDFGGWKLDTRDDVFGRAGNYSGGTPADGGIDGVELLVSSQRGVGILVFGGSIQALAVFPNGPLTGGWNLHTNINILGPTANYDGNGQDQILVTSSSGLGVLTLNRTTDNVNVPVSYELVATTVVPNGLVGTWPLDTTVDRLGCVGNYSPTLGELGEVQAGVFVTGPTGIAILKLSEYNGVSSPMVALNNKHLGDWRLDTSQDEF